MTTAELIDPFPRKRGGIVRYQIEKDEGWMDAINLIPALNFPKAWAVKIIPPFNGAFARFVVYHGDASVSVYADFNEALGYFGSPHWEIYPDADGDTARFPIADGAILISEIGKSLRKHNRAALKAKEADNGKSC